MKEEPVWGNEVVNDKLSTALDTCFSRQTVTALGFTALSQQSRDIPLMRAELPKQHVTSSDLQGLQLMTNNYIKDKTGFYTGFLATHVLPGAIGHSILRTSVKPRYIPLSNSQDPELVLLSSN